MRFSIRGGGVLDFTAYGVHCGDTAWIDDLHFRFAGKERGVREPTAEEIAPIHVQAREYSSAEALRKQLRDAMSPNLACLGP
jgi:hypothetical protein